jgi:predicted membrane-bound mannosyltransferase
MPESQSLPIPSGRGLAAAHRLADDVASAASVAPPAHVLQKAFPKEFYGDPNGEHGVGYIRPGMTQVERERNIDKMQALTREWAGRTTAASVERNEGTETVTVRRPDGSRDTVPARLEARLAEKQKLGAVASWGNRRTTYTYDEDGVRWRKHPHGEWEVDE